ncbi:hypothetical protein JCM3765_005999 [Sporobolomyces pararoseus]
MDQHHSPALDRLIRRQRVTGGEGTLPNAAAGGSSSESSASSPAAATTTTTTQPAATTTSAAPSTTTTTTSAQAETSSSSLVPSSSSSTTTTTTPVQETTSSSSSSTTTTTTTTAPTTSSTSTTSTSTTSSRAASTSDQADTAFSTSARTTVVVVSGSASSSSSGTASLASSTAGSSSGSSIGTGGVIGIVAGAVVGVVFVAALVAFLFKKYSRKNDDDQISPFDKDEFRRASVMLDDDDAYPESYHNGGGAGGMGHSPQMSEYSMSNVGVGAVLPGLARGGTLNNPRPPTAIMNHYQHQQMMPSFQPGQVVPTAPSPPMQYGGGGQQQAQFPNHSPPLGGNYAPMDPYGNYPQPPQPVQFADQTGGLSSAAAGHWNGVAPPMNMNGGDLSRNNSQMSSYSQYSDNGSRQIVPPALRPGASSHGHPDERPLSLVHEDDEPYSPSHGNFSRQQQQQRTGSPIEYLPERSGTPTNSNVQQTFFGAQGVTTAETGNDWEKEEREREQARRLSIRNGGLDQFNHDEDPYDGMH